MIDVILVNFHCVQDVLDAARSVLDQPVTVRLWLVDNSCSPSEATALRQAATDWPAQVLVAKENIGFGRACNWAFAEGLAPYVLLLNPDARLQPGALAALSVTLAVHPDAAAVGPAIYWDEALSWRICSSRLPSPRHDLNFALQQVSPLRVLFEAWQRRGRLAHLAAEDPHVVDNLSGGHVLLRRSLLVDGLFDPRYFMYFEDTDLFLRLRRAGLRLFEVPHAGVCHLYCHNADKDRMMATAEPLYTAKYFPRASLYRRLQAGVEHFLVAKRDLPAAHALAGEGDVIIPVPADWQAGWMLELSMSPAFLSVLVQRGCGSQAVVAADLLARLDGRCYLRLSSIRRWWQPSRVYCHG